jgi:hypothetical protein
MSPDSIARAAVDSLGVAFLAGDANAVLENFAASGDILYAGSEPGEIALGHAALRALLQELFARDERYSWSATSVVTTGGDDQLYLVAEADLLVHPHRSGTTAATPSEQIRYRVSGVIEREHDTWSWRMCQGSEPAEA